MSQSLLHSEFAAATAAALHREATSPLRSGAAARRRDRVTLRVRLASAWRAFRIPTDPAPMAAVVVGR